MYPLPRAQASDHFVRPVRLYPRPKTGFYAIYHKTGKSGQTYTYDRNRRFKANHAQTYLGLSYKLDKPTPWQFEQALPRPDLHRQQLIFEHTDTSSRILISYELMP